ncbi:MAG TPA: potassium channel family protein [Pyrinomonadaceae bacterium]|jgi:hypothetical protein|nr:potassium channel family protein [Pyrinomonadaceae bacterium]
MTILIAVVGCLFIFVVLLDAFEAIVLPRRVTRRLRLTVLFYTMTWQPWAAIARRIGKRKRREAYLSFFGPLSLIVLLMVWAVGLILGFAFLHWALGSEINMAKGSATGFSTDLYLSGTTFFTLGLGDIVPVTPLARAVTVIEAGTGFGFLAIIIGYLPVIYQAFSRREVNISLLDARAGTPSTAAELLRRHGRSGNMEALNQLLQDWERWSSDLMESHLSYPVLSYYRSQHDNQSWLAALTTILDTCALVIVGVDGAPAWQAQLTFAMARHAVVDIAQVFNVSPRSRDYERLPAGQLTSLRAALASSGVPLRDGEDADEKLDELRKMYEPYIKSLSDNMLMTLPPWIVEKESVDNWQTSAWERNPAVLATKFTKACQKDKDEAARIKDERVESVIR